MIRPKFVLLLLWSAFCGAGAARADVMEVGSAGFEWVTGAPKRAVTAPGAPQVQGESVQVDVHPASLTQPADFAGPEQWRPAIMAMAAKYDISPVLLEALVWQESRWRTGAVSSAGAYGLTQLMPGTARQLGVNSRDPMSNLEGGARYLRMQLDTFDGDIERALAAYNAGPGRVVRAAGVPRIRETQEYVVSVMGRTSSPVRR